MDTTLFRWINNLAGHASWIDRVVAFYANNGVALFAVLLVVAFLSARRSGDIAGLAGSLWAGAAAVVGLVVAQSIGRPIDRARPYTALRNVHLLLAKSGDFSFSSDHATTVSAVAVGLYLVNRRLGLVAGCCALAMAFARVYCGVHYPSDVLAGLAVGGIVALAGARLITPQFAKILRKWAGSPARALVSSAPAERAATRV
jgi:membrane-associated phospholipid phosphatase